MPLKLLSEVQMLEKLYTKKKKNLNKNKRLITKTRHFTPTICLQYTHLLLGTADIEIEKC